MHRNFFSIVGLVVATLFGATLYLLIVNHVDMPPGILLAPFHDETVARKFPFDPSEVCTYEGVESRCRFSHIYMREDITTEQLEALSSIVLRSKGRIFQTNIELRRFDIEFYNDADLMVFKKEIVKTPGVVLASYDIIVDVQ